MCIRDRDRAYYTTAGLTAVLGKQFTLASNGFRKRSPTTAAAPGRGKHGKWISEAVGRYMTLSLKNFGEDEDFHLYNKG